MANANTVCQKSRLWVYAVSNNSDIKNQTIFLNVLFWHDMRVTLQLLANCIILQMRAGRWVAMLTDVDYGIMTFYGCGLIQETLVWFF